MFPLPISAGNVGLGVVISSLILMFLDPDAPVVLFARWGKVISERFGDDMFKMGHACHFGGALVGWSYARWILRRPVTLERLQENRRRREKTETHS
jgi:membrane associated rhomboid family serine protease